MTNILKILASLGTVATGVLALVKPQAVRGFTGLKPEGGRGITEVRSVLGGLFIALGLYPLIIGSPAAYQMLGVAYLAIAVVRAVSMVVDRSVVQSNVISLVVEVIFGIILVL
jgi:hypothetical protein